jgi:hypothetical protein
MSFRLILRIAVLIGLLAMTIVAIFRLQRDGLPREMQNALSVEEGSTTFRPGEPSAPWPITVTLCPTRVLAIEQKGLFRLEQKGMEWISKTNEGMSLNQVAVEKWFGEFCEISAMATGGQKSPHLNPLLSFEYVDGDTEELLVSPTGTFVWKDQVFQSTELLTAISQLKALLGLGGASSDKE